MTFLGLNLGTLRDRSALYWFTAAASILIGMIIADILDENQTWLKTRYWIYQRLANCSPQQPDPDRTALVLIGDNEYWKGPLARRIPIRRDYLAQIVRKLDSCDPSVIALDFDLRSPMPDGTKIDNSEYEDETKLFISAILDASKHRAVILPATLGVNAKGYFFAESAVYGTLPLVDGRLQRGYIQFVDDIRKIPLAQRVEGGEKLDSFAEAVVRAARKSRRVKELDKSNGLAFGSFMEAERFTTIPAGDLISPKNDQACELIRHNIAIVGAAWHQFTFHTGALIDLHPTPVGLLSGVFVHANYVEALLGSRIRTPVRKALAELLDFTFAVILALLLAVRTERLVIKTALILALCVGVMLASYFAWQNLGLFFEAFFPTVFLLAHALGDYLYDLRRDARRFRNFPQHIQEG